MKKETGILILLIVVMAATSAANPRFLGAVNLMNIARWSGMYGILTIGVAFTIIAGGIDLSVGSIVGLIGCLLPLLLRTVGLDLWLTLLILSAVCLTIGLAHGLLVTKLRLQPFVVTLCGLFIYRSLARYFTGDATQGFGLEFQGLRKLANGTVFGVLPMPLVIMIVVAVVSAIFLNRTIWGRYMLAVGRNETAARYSGINTDRIVLFSYVISATLAGLAGVLFTLDLNSVQPSGHGNFYELYAIAGSVLGGCSLRGGEGTILGVVIGTVLVRVLYNVINILGIATQFEFAVIGLVILVGVSTDEIVRRYVGKRRAVRERGGS